jgi:hypothetical protein
VLSVGKDPLLIASFKEVTSIERDGIAERGESFADVSVFRPCKSMIEGCDIKPERSLCAPAEGPRRHLQEILNIRLGMPEGVEQVSKIGSRLSVSRIGPEQKGEVLAGLGGITVEEQVGE